ncbi:hypothetical protein [Fodinicola feengrottensis]|uniref:Uncharacterized protein n=2 Tax=Fodinicola feengrottensis TaxID=435914 RepID=A0ABN2INI2_9ACTN|nr:hypothetical protein [Fodinicola feengrottensis]
MQLYEHRLDGPLSVRGMRAMFAVAITRPISERARAELFDRWCTGLQRQAAARRIVWMPASGEAYTAAEVPTTRVEAVLLRILEQSPVLPPSPRQPADAQTR